MRKMFRNMLLLNRYKSFAFSYTLMKKVSNVEERIANQLKLSDGATTKDIARNLSIGMATASKYLEVLHATGQIQQKRIGPSNYWTLPKFPDAILNFEKFKNKLQMNDNSGLTFDNIGFIAFPLSSYTELIENMVEKFGYEKTKEIIYSTAKESGIKIYDMVNSSTKLEGLALLKSILNLLKFLGYGKLEVVNNNMTSGQLTIIHYPPAEYKLKNVKNNAHFLTSGMLAGIVSKITGLKLEYTETKCTAKGDRHCEHVTQPISIKKIDKKMAEFNRKMERRHRAMEYRLRFRQ